MFTDGIHLVSSDSIRELHAFAHAIELPRRWFHNSPRHPHYDLLTDESRQMAVNAGAVQRTSRELVLILRTVPYLPPR